MFKTLQQIQKDFNNDTDKIADEISKLYLIAETPYATVYDTQPIPKYISNAYIGNLVEVIHGDAYYSDIGMLCEYDLIPEAVFVFTFVTLDDIDNGLDAFREEKLVGMRVSYHSIPKDAFYEGVTEETLDGYVCHVATKEKALCDRLYRESKWYDTPISVEEMRTLLFDDWRVNEYDFAELSIDKMIEYAKSYNNPVMDNFVTYLQSDEDKEAYYINGVYCGNKQADSKKSNN